MLANGLQGVELAIVRLPYSINGRDARLSYARLRAKVMVRSWEHGAYAGGGTVGHGGRGG